MIAAGLAIAALAAAVPEVAVDLLARQAPRAIVVRGGGPARAISAGPGGLFVDGQTLPSLALPRRSWRVELAGAPPRTYDAALLVRAEGGVLRIRARMPLERYVAAVVASEAPPETPAAALEALAVVVRSYALAARGRHADGALCDLAHCQLLRGSGIGRRHLAAAERAARATEGEVLALRSGEIAEATFHAACGGHTADPRAAFGSAASGARAALDPGCEGATWQADVDPAGLADAVRAALARSDVGAASSVRRQLRAADLVLSPGPGGWIARVEASDGRFLLSGDAFARALDAVVGRGKVRGTRLTLADEGGKIAVRGSGHGHGVGLCQAGAARQAEAGAGYRAILARYFRAEVTSLRREHRRRAASVKGGLTAVEPRPERAS